MPSAPPPHVTAAQRKHLSDALAQLGPLSSTKIIQRGAEELFELYMMSSSDTEEISHPTFRVTVIAVALFIQLRNRHMPVELKEIIPFIPRARHALAYRVKNDMETRLSVVIDPIIPRGVVMNYALILGYTRTPMATIMTITDDLLVFLEHFYSSIHTSGKRSLYSASILAIVTHANRHLPGTPSALLDKTIYQTGIFIAESINLPYRGIRRILESIIKALGQFGSQHGLPVDCYSGIEELGSILQIGKLEMLTNPVPQPEVSAYQSSVANRLRRVRVIHHVCSLIQDRQGLTLPPSMIEFESESYEPLSEAEILSFEKEILIVQKRVLSGLETIEELIQIKDMRFQ